MVDRTPTRRSTPCGCRVASDPCGTDFPVGHRRWPTRTDRLESRSNSLLPAGPYDTTVIEDADGVPLALATFDPRAVDGYYHDFDLDRALDTRPNAKRCSQWLAGNARCRESRVDSADYADLMACANDTPFDPLCIYTHDRNADRRVDLVDVGVYLTYADSNGVPGGADGPGLAPYGRPLRLDFDANADGLIDLFDWHALQTCYDRTNPRCRHLFDHDLSATVNAPDLDAFKLSAASAHAGPQAKRWRPSLTASRYGNPFMWTGQRFDATTGQYHFWARTYSPRLGRWMQRDPLEYVDGPNVYEYSQSSALTGTDPLGLQFMPGPKKGGRFKLEGQGPSRPGSQKCNEKAFLKAYRYEEREKELRRTIAQKFKQERRARSIYRSASEWWAAKVWDLYDLLGPSEAEGAVLLAGLAIMLIPGGPIVLAAGIAITVADVAVSLGEYLQGALNVANPVFRAKLARLGAQVTSAEQWRYRAYLKYQAAFDEYMRAKWDLEQLRNNFKSGLAQARQRDKNEQNRCSLHKDHPLYGDPVPFSPEPVGPPLPPHTGHGSNDGGFN